MRDLQLQVGNWLTVGSVRPPASATTSTPTVACVASSSSTTNASTVVSGNLEGSSSSVPPHDNDGKFRSFHHLALFRVCRVSASVHAADASSEDLVVDAGSLVAAKPRRRSNRNRMLRSFRTGQRPRSTRAVRAIFRYIIGIPR
jgi:hypothetical protein